jgi:hypothetical protein
LAAEKVEGARIGGRCRWRCRCERRVDGHRPCGRQAG